MKNKKEPKSLSLIIRNTVNSVAVIKHKHGNFDNIPLCKLNYQFILGATNHDIWHFDMSLPNSPEVECAQLLLEYGRDWNKLKDCRFAQDRRYRSKLKISQWWTEERIKEDILGSRWDVLMSIKKNGFNKKLNEREPVSLLMFPLWKTRFGYTANWLNGYEIYHGGRRCAAMYVLGYKTVPVIWRRDKKPGSGNIRKYKKILKNLRATIQDEK